MSQSVDRHQGKRSHTTSGEYSSTLKRTGRPSITCAASRSLPLTSRQTNGAISRHFLGGTVEPGESRDDEIAFAIDVNHRRMSNPSYSPGRCVMA
ncbi:hypothetical protein [Sphingosinicella soli]|uniref:Uncharacterized protein n=1 Tax=Sphingosinicella soli TaxID=333708 RepID=A0A7W7B4Q8_9SPHN|nr:hypothetical protein [Sphingosinicella soli]MBB4633972.1 hypothetical protein [Sphingosinicella soli]